MNDLVKSKRPIIYRPAFTMQRNGFLLRAIRNRDELEDVYRLTYECYLQKGYCRKNDSGKLAHYSQFDELDETMIFIVEDQEGRLLGTVSTTIDNRIGLHVDLDFHNQADQVRHEGRALASCWRIAVNEKYRSQLQVSRLLVDGSVAYWYATHIETCLMTLHPHHEGFYKRYLNCTTLGWIEGLGDINSQAILMRWDDFRCPLKNRLFSTTTNNTIKH